MYDLLAFEDLTFSGQQALKRYHLKNFQSPFFKNLPGNLIRKFKGL